MNDNMSVNIKQWFVLDEKIKELKKKIKELTNEKKDLSSRLIQNMKTNNIDIVETNNGKIIHNEKKVRSSITKKYLAECFEKFIKDTETRDSLLKYIFDSREIKMVENIKRK